MNLGILVAEEVFMTRQKKIWVVGQVSALVGAAALSAWLALTAQAAQGPKVLLQAIDINMTDLNEKQTKILERIKKSDATVNWQLTRLNPGALEAADTPIALSLPERATMEIRQAKVAKTDERTHVTWKGEKITESLQLSVVGRSTTGLVYTNDKVYSVEPIGNGLQCVAQLDQRKFKEDHPANFKQIEKKEARKVKAADSASPVVITVLVAYTPKVDQLQADVNALIRGAVDLANTTYANSKINIKLELVATVPVTYVESGTHETDLERFRKKDDGFMDEIHMIRDQKKADVCVLLIDNDQYCGLAAAILATEDTAFAVVHHDCAVKNLSFPHEIGHLQGARHNLEVDPTIDPSYPYNHGYLSQMGNWRTVMAYPTQQQPNRLPYWSNPNVMYMGEPMGTVDKQNNALMLNQSALTVSQFR
jgi:hypothetical protein